MKNILISLGIIGIVAAIAIGSTVAYFSDVETSTGNTFTAGTFDLKAQDGDETYRDGITATWVMSDMEPGVSIGAGTMDIQNWGTIAADHVEIVLSHTIDEDFNPVESDTEPASNWQDLAEWIEITGMIYGSVPLRAIIMDSSGWDVNDNGWLDLQDVASSPNIDEGGPMDNLPVPPPNADSSWAFAMSLFFRAEATNDIQGDRLITTITFTLNQDSTQ